MCVCCMAAWVMHGYVCSCVVTCVHAWLHVFVHGYMRLAWLCVSLLWSRLQFSQWLLTQKLGGWDVFGVAFLGAGLITPPKPWGLVSGQCGDVTALHLCLEPCCPPLLYPHLCPPPYLKFPVAWQPPSPEGSTLLMLVFWACQGQAGEGEWPVRCRREAGDAAPGQYLPGPRILEQVRGGAGSRELRHCLGSCLWSRGSPPLQPERTGSVKVGSTVNPLEATGRRYDVQNRAPHAGGVSPVIPGMAGKWLRAAKAALWYPCPPLPQPSRREEAPSPAFSVLHRAVICPLGNNVLL